MVVMMTDYRKGPLFEITRREGERVTACECGIQPGETCDVCGAYRGDAKDLLIRELVAALTRVQRYSVVIGNPTIHTMIADVLAKAKAAGYSYP